MTPAQEQALDTAILRLLDEQRTRLGLGIDAFALLLVRFGFAGAKHEEIYDRLDYLERKGLVAEVGKKVHRANRSWRITDGEDGGIAYLDKEG